MLTVEPAASVPAELRRAYLGGLPEPQELYVEEILVKPGQVWRIARDGAWIGYAVINEGALVELHCEASVARQLDAVANEVIRAAGVERIVSKSFDRQLMFVALGTGTPPRTVGRLYRDVVDPGFVEQSAISVRLARAAELSTAKAVDPDFFDDDEVTAALIGEDGLFFYERGADLLGCGLLKRVIPGRDDFDLGMAVAPQHRGDGLGAYVIGHLKALCLARGVRPICGHHVSNIASQRSLERAGFLSLHRLVEFDL